MGLYFENATSSTIWVAYGHPSNYSWCDVGWYKKGWYRITPGSTAKVWSGAVGGHSFMYYAEDEAAHVWAGRYRSWVPDRAFYFCWEDTSTPPGTVVGFRYFVVGWLPWDYTKRLVV